MKTKVFFITGIVMVGVFLSSCEDQLDPVAEPVNKETEIDSQATSKDNLETMYMMQSNPELILADRIISRSAGFVLDLSEEEARELQIPGDLYRKYVDKVSELNKQHINNLKWK